LNGRDCGKKLGNVDLKTSIHPSTLQIINATVEYEIFQLSDSMVADYSKYMWWKVESLKNRTETTWEF